MGFVKTALLLPRALPVGARVAVIVMEPGVNGIVAVEPALTEVQAKMTSSIDVRLGPGLSNEIVTVLFVEVIVDPDANVTVTGAVVPVVLQLPSDTPVGIPANVNSSCTELLENPPFYCAMLRYISM